MFWEPKTNSLLIEIYTRLPSLDRDLRFIVKCLISKLKFFQLLTKINYNQFILK